MQNKTEVIIYDYLDRFLRKVDSESPLLFQKIIGTFDNIGKVGIEKAKKGQVVKQIKGHKESIYEIVVSTPRTQYRFMGTVIKEDLHIVHAFLKKEQKTRKTDIDITKKRLKREHLI